MVIVGLARMTTYVLSQLSTHWFVSQYGEESGEPLFQSTSEEDALAAIVEQARLHRPSQIVRISLSGESRIVAHFDEEPEAK
jgi:hypothetical protein